VRSQSLVVRVAWALAGIAVPSALQSCAPLLLPCVPVFLWPLPSWLPQRLLKRNAAGEVDPEQGQVYGAPFRLGCLMVAWRTDKLSAAGVPPIQVRPRVRRGGAPQQRSALPGCRPSRCAAGVPRAGVQSHACRRGEWGE